MPKFDATSIAAVEYDFYGFTDSNGDPIEDKGVVPEPSRALVNETLNSITTAMKGFGVQDVEDNPDSIVNAMSKIEGEDQDIFVKMTENILEAMAKLCGATAKPLAVIDPSKGETEESVVWEGGHPSYQSLEKLDYRPFMAFFAYLMSEMMSPEASRPDTKPTRSHLRSV